MRGFHIEMARQTLLDPGGLAARIGDQPDPGRHGQGSKKRQACEIVGPSSGHDFRIPVNGTRQSRSRHCACAGLGPVRLIELPGIGLSAGEKYTSPGARIRVASRRWKDGGAGRKRRTHSMARETRVKRSEALHPVEPGRPEVVGYFLHPNGLLAGKCLALDPCALGPRAA